MNDVGEANEVMVVSAKSAVDTLNARTLPTRRSFRE
jgi:hypothetical protein